MTLQGHMARAIRQLSANIKAVDVVLEVVDARAPLVTMNSRMNVHIAQKPSVLVLNKSDLGGEDTNRAWKSYWQKEGRIATLWSANKSKPAELIRLARLSIER